MFVWTSRTPAPPAPPAANLDQLIAQLAACDRVAPTEEETDLEYVRRAR